MVADGRVGGLYVTVGVDVKKAMSDTQRLHERMTRLSKQINTLGTGSKLPVLTRQLNAVATAAAKANKELAKIGVRPAAVSGAQGAPLAAVTKAQVQAQRVMQQQINAAHAEAIKMEAARSVAVQRNLQAEIRATGQAANAQARAAQQGANAAVKEAGRVTAAVTAETAKQTRAVEKEAEKQARAVEKAAQKEIKAAEAVAKKKTSVGGVVGSGGQQLLVGLGAARSGNYFYGLAAAARYAQSVQTEMGGLVGVMSRVSVAAIGVGTAITAAATGVAYLTVKISAYGIQQAAAFQMLQLQLEGLLGSAIAGQREMNFLLNLGKESIVPTQSLIAADRQLAAFGVTATNVRRELVTFISDFGTATGATEMQVYYLSLALGQVAAIGKANTIDMRQLANAGINTMGLYKIIGKDIGKSAQEVAAGVKDGIVTADVLFKALSKYGKGFAETAEKAKKSTIGLLSNIKDIVATEMGRAFEGLNTSVGTFLQYVKDVVESIDFKAIAQAAADAGNAIISAFGPVQQDAGELADTFSTTIPNAIRTTGEFFAGLVKVVQVVVDSFQIAARAIVMIANYAMVLLTGMQAALNDLMDRANLVSDEVGAMVRADLERQRDEYGVFAENTYNEIVGLANGIDELLSRPVTKYLRVVITSNTTDGSSKGTYVGSTYDASKTGVVYENNDPYMDDPIIPEVIPTTSSGSGSAAKAVDKELERMKRLIERIKELTTSARDAMTSLYEALREPFKKAREAMGEDVQSAAEVAFSSGEVDTIIGQYESMQKSIVAAFAPLESKALNSSKKSRLNAKALRQQYIAELRYDTIRLVQLAAADTAARAKFEKAEADITKAQEAISNRRDALAKAYVTRQRAIAKQYDSYYTATSMTEGTFTKGAIQIAQEALDRATALYEAAQSKLDDLRRAREDFLNSIADSIRSFVNDLSTVSTEIQRYTRLDEVGSFLLEVDKSVSADSFAQSLRQRLDALKKWKTDIQSLVAAGLDSALLQSLVAQGPEASGEIVSQLAAASAQQIAEVNAMQGELNTEILAVQQIASAQWFDAGIAAQEAFTAPLKAAYDAAKLQVETLTLQKELALGVLEAWNTEQNELLDAEDAVQAQRLADATALLNATLEANKASALLITSEIQANLGTLPGGAVDTGIATLQGLIDGLNDEAKKKELFAVARSIAAAVKRTLRDALEISSPSKVTTYMGEMLGEGLAVGMENSMARVESGALRLAGASVPNAVGGDGGAHFSPTVKVFIGDRELTDLVDLRIETADARSLDYVVSGRRY